MIFTKESLAKWERENKPDGKAALPKAVKAPPVVRKEPPAVTERTEQKKAVATSTERWRVYAGKNREKIRARNKEAQRKRRAR